MTIDLIYDLKTCKIAVEVNMKPLLLSIHNSCLNIFFLQLASRVEFLLYIDI